VGEKVGLMKMAVFFLIWGMTLFANQKQEQVDAINDQIEELQDMKRGFEGRALRHENMAEYLQFDQRAVLETRRHLQLAEENRQKAAKVQEQIDFLMEKKKKILEKK
jgi:hypothetical protein